ncbi:MAG: hypothetical protein U5K79_10880 [Cyclobacteriaceae bacterium]|nr:hypothetical protein [Cyclobacteriaceae bacterium]
MKKTLIMLAGLLIVSTFAFAQSDNNYRMRNHKLNPNHSKDVKQTAYTVPAKKDISADVYSYMARNNKLNQNSREAALELVTPPKDYHYRAMNHKLNKNYRNSSTLTDDTAVTHK